MAKVARPGAGSGRSALPRPRVRDDAVGGVQAGDLDGLGLHTLGFRAITLCTVSVMTCARSLS